MKLAINDLGERLVQYRKALGLLQTDVAEKTELNQNQISRIETGLGGSLESVLDLINFYSNHFHLASLLTDEFEVIKKSEAITHSNSLNNVVAEKLKILQNDLNDVRVQITDIIGTIEKETGM